MKKYTTIDLCAGIGGIRTGFTSTGRFENVLSAEIDKEARRTYHHLYGEMPMSDLTSEEFKLAAVKKRFDVMLAGFPCQTFSAVGLKKGFDDPTKGIIFEHLMDIIMRCTNAHCRPKAIFLENVEHLLAHDKRRTINTILDYIKRMGYRVVGNLTRAPRIDDAGEWHGVRKAFLRNSRNFGVPQNRPRVFIMAFDERYFGEAISLLDGVELPESGEGPGWKHVSEILESDTSKIPDKYYLSSGIWKTLQNHRKRHADSEKASHGGFGCVVVNDPTYGGTGVAHTILATGGSGRECNLIKQHKPDLNTRDLINGKRSPLNTEGIRFMIPEEWGRLQGFVDYAFVNPETGKDGFSFPDGMSDAQKYKQFGNSVTIPVIRAMADFMLERLDEMESLRARFRILDHIAKNGFISEKQIENILNIDYDVAKHTVSQLMREGKIFRRRDGKMNVLSYSNLPPVGSLHG